MFIKILNFLFPKHCLGCGKNGSYICTRCVAAIAPAEPLDLPNTMACFHYHDGVIKRALQMLKYKKQFSVASDLAQSLYDRLLEEIAEGDQFLNRTEPIILVPAPLSKERNRERGYNQAEVLAQELAKLNPELFVVDTKIIKKVRDTASQVSVKDRAKRLQNIKGAFALKDASRAQNQVLVIIDDVITTGATVSEITAVLREASPKKVYALAVAHG